MRENFEASKIAMYLTKSHNNPFLNTAIEYNTELSEWERERERWKWRAKIDSGAIGELANTCTRVTGIVGLSDWIYETVIFRKLRAGNSWAARGPIYSRESLSLSSSSSVHETLILPFQPESNFPNLFLFILTAWFSPFSISTISWNYKTAYVHTQRFQNSSGLIRAHPELYLPSHWNDFIDYFLLFRLLLLVIIIIIIFIFLLNPFSEWIMDKICFQSSRTW